jgi:hypothetical protein
MWRRVLVLLVLSGVLGGFVLGYWGSSSLGQDRPGITLANPLQQRAEMIEELRQIRALLREQNEILREQNKLLQKLAAGGAEAAK